MAWSALAYVLLGVIGYFAFMPLFRWLLGLVGLDRFDEIGTVFYVVLWILASGILFIGLASFLSSLLWDKLSAEVEELATGAKFLHPVSKAVVIADSARRMVLTVFLGVLALFGGMCLPVVGPALIAAYAGLLDYTAPAFMRRGYLLPTQRRELRKLKGWAGFAIVAGLVTLIPFVNILMLPIMVAAGTLMVARTPIPPRPPA